jgi:hypothetical protein
VLDALASGLLAHYVCDFPSPQLARPPGVVALPHLGASTREAEENCAVMVVDQLRDYLEHGNIANAVNFPSVAMARESALPRGHRQRQRAQHAGPDLHRDGQAGLNIHNMVNKSRGEMAYTLVDVDSPWAAGSDAPEKEEVRIGFIPLTDCASVVMASVLGFDKKYGVKIIPTKEALGRRARQAGQRRARHGARAVRPGLRRAPGRQRPEEGHGRADEPEPQRPGASRCRRSWPTRAPSTGRAWPR